MEWVISFFSIVLIDLILSGDNAVVIALACRSLPVHQRKKAVLWGTAGAVGLRVILAMIATFLLQIPYVQFLGGIALLWIAVHLLNKEEKNEKTIKEASKMGEAIRIILAADFIMSLDNVLAIAGVANGHWFLLLFGLALSIPIVIYGSQFLMKLMDKYPAIIYVGAAVLGWTAAKMMVADQALGSYLAPYSLIIEIVLTLGVLAIGYALKWRG